MKTFLLTLSSLGLLTFSAAGQLATTAQPAATTPASHALTTDEQLFTGLVEQLSAAISKGDMAALGRYMAPDYVHYTPDNSTGNRAADLAYVGSWSNAEVKLMSPIRVARRGDMAVTVATSTFSGVVDGQPFKSNIQMMIAWVLREGHWQMAVVQSKAMPG
ncbi:MAG: nuclear transport factor 2 family protein [Janthinobacterium lividum]